MSAAPTPLSATWFGPALLMHAEKKARAEQLAKDYAAYPDLRSGLHESGVDCLCIASILIEFGIPLPKKMVGDCIGHIQSHSETAAKPKPSRKGRHYE